MSASRSITSVSSGTLISNALNLDYNSAKFTSFGVTGSSSGTFTYTIEGALDDLTQFSSVGTSSAATLFWFALSSATTTNSSLSVYQGPLAAIRVNASAMSSAILTLRSLQGIGW